MIRQSGVLQQHRREPIYNIAGNHDASPDGHPASVGKQAKWWWCEWVDPQGGHPETSLVDNVNRPYPIGGTWERRRFRFGNVRAIMMSNGNDLPYPIGRKAGGGASPASPMTEARVAWWQQAIDRARANNEIIISCRHHMLPEMSVGSGNQRA